MGSKATPPLARTGEAGAKRPRLMGSDGEMLDVPDDDADEEERAATFELEAAGSPSPRKRTSKAPPSSPRVQRLEVREQKKASVKCASTLDFTALSVKRPPHTRAPAHYHRSTTDDVLESPQACDKVMFRDCQDGCEAERAHGGHGQDGCEAEGAHGKEGVAMADRTAISTRICSQLKRVRTIDGDSDVDHDLRDLCFLSKSVFKHPARPQSSRGGSSLRRGSVFEGMHSGNGGDEDGEPTSAPPTLTCAPNLGRGLGPGSHLAVLRAHSLRSSALSRLETLCADDTSTAGSSTAALHATLQALRPSPRPDGSTYGTHGGVTGPRGRKSPMGVTAWVTGTHGRKSPLGIRAGDSIPEDSFRSRSHSMLSRNGSRSQGSLSSCAGSQSGRISSHANRLDNLETPPGNPNAHEAHKLLVRCPAPRRPPLYAVDRKSRWHLDTSSTEAF